MDKDKTDNKLTINAIYAFEQNKKILIPILESTIAAGFPSSAENFIDKVLDLNELLIKHPTATFFVRVKGDSMIKAGIHSNDILIVDRALQVANNKIVVARLNNEFTVKRVKIDNGKLFLMPDNDTYKPIEVTTEMDFEVWGVVVFVIHQV